MAVSQIHENHWYNERGKVVMTVSHIHETTQRKKPEKIKTVSLIHESSKWKGDQGRDVTDLKNKNKLVGPWKATLKFYSADKFTKMPVTVSGEVIVEDLHVKVPSPYYFPWTVGQRKTNVFWKRTWGVKQQSRVTTTEGLIMVNRHWSLYKYVTHFDKRGTKYLGRYRDNWRNHHLGSCHQCIAF